MKRCRFVEVVVTRCLGFWVDHDALSALWALYPGVQDRIATEQGQVREHINIFIGDENIRYTGGLASPISAGSEISIVPAVSGG